GGAQALGRIEDPQLAEAATRDQSQPNGAGSLYQPGRNWRLMPETLWEHRAEPVLATSLFGDAAAALREHRSAALDEHCWSCAALTES
ncbi:MAG TPA: hypothetical protein VJ305_20990, partial [Streptosporangiaceae bacterium]|nr:hypothetical protein [Streptosporangiaceae bacterium]